MEGSEAAGVLARGLAAEEDRSQTRKVHAQRRRRRQDHREKRQKPERAGAVLHRTRSHAVRTCSVVGGQEQNYRLPEHSEERSGTDYRNAAIAATETSHDQQCCHQTRTRSSKSHFVPESSTASC